MGEYETTFTVFDGGLSDSKTISIKVNDVNVSPTMNNIGDKTVTLGSTLEFNVSANDPDEDDLKYHIRKLPLKATFIDQNFKWKPLSDQLGKHEITFLANDGVFIDSKTIIITVTQQSRSNNNTSPPSVQLPTKKSNSTAALNNNNVVHTTNSGQALHFIAKPETVSSEPTQKQNKTQDEPALIAEPEAPSTDNKTLYETSSPVRTLTSARSITRIKGKQTQLYPEEGLDFYEGNLDVPHTSKKVPATSQKENLPILKYPKLERPKMLSVIDNTQKEGYSTLKPIRKIERETKIKGRDIDNKKKHDLKKKKTLIAKIKNALEGLTKKIAKFQDAIKSRFIKMFR